MEATTMRKMMLATTLMFAACGATESVDNNGSGDGSDGSGGMDAGVPTACTSAEDCGDGEACDLTSQQCVTGGLTIEPTAEVVNDGTQWWTSVSDPTVRGTFDGPASAVIEISVGAESIAATLQGNTWSAQLPAGTITDAGVQLKVTMTGGAALELVQTFRLDTVAPQIALATSKVRDERGDTIDFSSGEPVHTHAGAEIDLDAGACPSIYKYPYLDDALSPTFGTQSSQNPLVWNFSVAEANVVAAMFRVRNASNQVVLDWTSVTPSGSGAYRVELRRDLLPALGTYAGQINVDMRARDWTGLETTYSRCIDYHPLAAPLKIEALQPSSTTQGNAPGLFSMSLTADSQISVLAGIGTGAAIADQRITQYTAEPITVSLQGSISNLRVERTYIDEYVAVSTSPGLNCTTGCSWDMPADPPDSTTNGPASAHSFTVGLFDETTNQIFFSNPAVIPARGANEAPRSYRVVAFVGQLWDLRPGSWIYPGEYTLAGLTYTGTAPGADTKICTATGWKSVMGELYEVCTTMTTFKRMHALDRAALAMDGINIELETSPLASIPGTTPSYVAPTAFSLGATTWSAGDDDLPGPH